MHEHDHSEAASGEASGNVPNVPDSQSSQPDTPAAGDPAPPTAPEQKPAAPDLDDILEREISEALGGMSVEDLMAEDGPTSVPVASGGRQTRTGRIIREHGGDVFIEFGPRSQGACPASQFKSQSIEVVPGAEHEFVVERFDPFEQLLVCSLPGSVVKADWGTLEAGQIVEARCTGVNKGGLEMEVAHHKGFMPAGQVDLRHIEDISVMIGEKFACKIIELKKNKNRLVLSRRAVLVEERKEQGEKLLGELQPGDVRTATVTSVQPYGAFADLGGIDGLIHVSDLSHERIKHPSEVVKEGDEVQVKITKIDRDATPPRISLSRKQVIADPAIASMQTIEEGAEVTGRVTRTTDFGAFVEVGPGLEGLVHISELSHKRVPTVDSVVRKGEVIRVQVLSVDHDRRRVSLSMKALEAPPATAGGRGDRDGGGGMRAEDPAMRKLRNKFGDQSLKGGLG